MAWTFEEMKVLGKALLCFLASSLSASPDSAAVADSLPERTPERTPEAFRGEVFHDLSDAQELPDEERSGFEPGTSTNVAPQPKEIPHGTSTNGNGEGREKRRSSNLELPDELQSPNADSDIWSVICRGCFLPAVDSFLVYSPEGHSSASQSRAGELPVYRVLEVELRADRTSDEPFAVIKLAPENWFITEKDLPQYMTPSEENVDEGLLSFEKSLTISDAYSGKGLTLTKKCADVLPPLDFSVDKPVQEIECFDIHGEKFLFQHNFSGKPPRHCLTRGWSSFLKRKRLMQGDCVVFLRRPESTRIGIGLRRASYGDLASITEINRGEISKVDPDLRDEVLYQPLRRGHNVIFPVNIDPSVIQPNDSGQSKGAVATRQELIPDPCPPEPNED